MSNRYVKYTGNKNGMAEMLNELFALVFTLKESLILICFFFFPMWCQTEDLSCVEVLIVEILE